MPAQIDTTAKLSVKRARSATSRAQARIMTPITPQIPDSAAVRKTPTIGTVPVSTARVETSPGDGAWRALGCDQCVEMIVNEPRVHRAGGEICVA